MTALTLTLRAAPALPVDCSPLTPDKLAGKSAVEIAATALQSGRHRLKAGDLFEISGDAGDSLVIRNACTKLDRIGAGMVGGTLEVEGNVGSYLGAGMKDGTIRVAGNAGLLAATGMTAGLLHVRGNVGDFLGAAIAGDKQGMLGGVVVVGGNAGARVGDHMRRGIILIGGNAGDYCGSRMLAGTIMVRGGVGRLPGFAMKRGTLLFSGNPELPATFNDCGTHELMFLRLFSRHLRELGPETAAFAPAGERVRRWLGDRGNGGVGEVLVTD
jgi:formylmethanofuran dehydrogenase subunit C